jgi:hypothetical protein
LRQIELVPRCFQLVSQPGMAPNCWLRGFLDVWITTEFDTFRLTKTRREMSSLSERIKVSLALTISIQRTWVLSITRCVKLAELSFGLIFTTNAKRLNQSTIYRIEKQVI